MIPLRYMALAIALLLPAAAADRKPDLPPAVVQTIVAARGDLFERCAASASQPVRSADLVTASRMALRTGDKQPDLLVRGTGCLCSEIGNCPAWIFRRDEEGDYRILLDAAGAGVQTAEPLAGGAHGRSDIRTTTRITPAAVLQVDWRFDGVLYRPVRCVRQPPNLASGGPAGVDADCSTLPLGSGAQPRLRRPGPAR